MQRKRPLQREAELEDLLWLRLRGLKAFGWHFRKSAPFRSFLLAYAEHEKLLVVEVAEEGHAVRDRLLREEGYTILRFPRAEAEGNLDGILDRVCAVLKDRS